MASIQCGFVTLLDRKYQRNNKDTGQKNLRCFPNCDRTRGHIIHGYCGTFVNIFVKGESPGARLHAWAIFGLYRDSPDVRIGDVRKLQDIRSKLERGRGNPGRPWIPGERTESGFQFNRNRQGWHYGWTSSVHTSDSAHVLRAYVFEEMPNVEGHIRCVGYAESSEFRLLQQFSSPQQQQQQQVPPQSQSQPRPVFQHNTGHASASLAQMSQLQAQGGMTQPMNTFPDLQNASWAHQLYLPPNDQYQQPQNNRPEQSVAMFQQLAQNNPEAMAAFAYAAAGLGLWPAQTTTSGVGSHLGASYQPRRPSALLPQEEPPHDLQQERARQNLQGFSSASNLNISSMGVAYTRASPAAPEVPPIDESEPRGHLVRANATKSPHSPPPGSQAANPGHTQGVSSSLRPFGSSGSATWSSNMGNNNSNDAEND
ncbi:Hypothetical Protein FCC1311_001222 [Hondaea fermentalgiana]|uniref:Uncharacterized protein n=1 Tax=Hondaea fermentalgiana TaxID=2315210 RepID=A0A2R5G641_9STRA|nr:Hypothetical Protein FCC1311_001222 [Hondaea fermentalgiana]|eukprot:GBG23903.1 Hypothetical Protein FCC1311_001222 [Hondaea fermentalgiana]